MKAHASVGTSAIAGYVVAPCRVTAENSRGTSVVSGASNALNVGAPVRPATPSIARVGTGELRVTFTRLTTAQANGSPLTARYYAAACVSSNGGVTKSASAKASPITVTHLSSRKTYTCTIRAHNARGYSTWSHAVGIPLGMIAK